MAIGMSYDDYWNGDPDMAQAYIKAHEIKNEQKNQEMWLQGWYVFKAIEISLYNQPAFAKPPKYEPYLKEPVRITPLTEEEREAEEQKKLDEVVAYFENFQKNWENRHGRS